MSTPNAERQIADLTTLLDISRRLGATTELIPLLEEIAEASNHILNCERTSVFLYDPKAHELYSQVATGTSEIRFSADRGIAGESIRTGNVINVPDAYADARFNQDIDKATGFKTRNLLTFPMRGHDRSLVGVLQVLNRKGGPFEERDEELADTLSSLAGVAIQRQRLIDEYTEKRRIERDLAVARDIQQSLLPQSDPKVKGYEIAGFNLPADETGGDCYDFLELGEHLTGLVIADATGHGIGPALLVSQFLAMVKALATTDIDPLSVLSKVNALLGDEIPNNMFITSFLGIVDSKANTINYLSAGHGPLIHYRRSDGQVAEMQADTIPLGILDPLVVVPPPTIEMEPGDIFLLITDGMFEWNNESGEQYGIERIIETLRDNPDATASELIELMRSRLKQFVGNMPQPDDLTAIVARRLPA
ncbi:MAG: SpoIIE family protein phosphatase [Phycisphaerales bacterium]|nr:SpoIIE family protein phosphatase [Phycisphaerales bacterium]